MAARRLRRPAEGVDRAGRRLDWLVGDRARRAGAAVGVRPDRPAASTGSACARRATELQALIEAVVVPETWFFRDREAFATLAGIGHERLAARVRGRRAAPAEPAVLDRRRAVFDGDGAARRRRPGGSLSHRRRGHQRAGDRAGASARCTGRIRFAARSWRFAIVTSKRRRSGYRLSDAVRRQVHFRAGQPVRRGFSAGAGHLRRDLLPQSADLLRPRHAGPRRRRAASVC